HLEGRCRLPAARDDRSRTRREDLAAFEQGFDGRMVLVLLKGFEGLQTRIAVVEAHDVPDIHPIAVEVIEEAAGVCARVSGPAERMLDAAGTHTTGGQLPQLLVAEREGLRAVVLRKVELADELFRDRATAAFREHPEARVDLHARCVVGSGLTVSLQ